MLNIFRGGLIFIFFQLLLACHQNTENANATSENKYSLFIIDKAGKKFLVETNDLKSGEINPDKQNILNNIEGIHREMIVHNGYYFRLNPKTKEFTKYRNINNKLRVSGTFPLDNFYIENYIWITEDSLIIFDTNIKETPQSFNYIKIDTRDMKFIRGKLPIAVLNNITGSSIGFSKLRNREILLGYSFHNKEAEGYRTLDTSYIAVLSYPDFHLKKIIKNTRSTYPGGENAVEPSSFTDEHGDFYYLTCPGVAMGNTPDKPTALFRIRKGASSIDSTYFLNISGSVIQNHAYSIYYLGEGKAIIRNERKDLFTKWDDHWKVPHFEFHLADIATGKVRKLNLPLDKGTRRQCVLKEGDIVYISINAGKDGNYIWNYNLKTDTLQKGLKLSGSTDFILRLDKLN